MKANNKNSKQGKNKVEKLEIVIRKRIGSQIEVQERGIKSWAKAYRLAEDYLDPDEFESLDDCRVWNLKNNVMVNNKPQSKKAGRWFIDLPGL